MLWTMETAALLIPMLFLLIGLAVTMLIDPYIKKRDRRLMLMIIISTFIDVRWLYGSGSDQPDL